MSFLLLFPKEDGYKTPGRICPQCGSRSGKSGIPRFILVLWSLMKYILLGEKEITGWHQKNLRIRKKASRKWCANVLLWSSWTVKRTQLCPALCLCPDLPLFRNYCARRFAPEFSTEQTELPASLLRAETVRGPDTETTTATVSQVTSGTGNRTKDIKCWPPQQHTYSLGRLFIIIIIFLPITKKPN